MTPYEAFKFCPRCGSDTFHHDSKNMMTCDGCKWHMFVNASPTVGIIIENENNQVMLAKRGIEPFKGYWDIPGGFMEPHETAAENAHREAQEELGVKIKTGLITSSYPATYPYKEIDIPVLIQFMVAKIVEGEPKADDDVAEIKYFSEEEITQLKEIHPAIKQAYLEYFQLRKKVPLEILFSE
jgi:mutator protein MutT